MKDSMIRGPNADALRQKFWTAWKHVIERYKGYDRIAGYEVLSEPRDQSAPADVIRQFYKEGIQAMREVDDQTPIVVGPGSYYKLYLFNDDIIHKNADGSPLDDKLIYTFDNFNPDKFVFHD